MKLLSFLWFVAWAGALLALTIMAVALVASAKITPILLIGLFLFAIIAYFLNYRS